MSDGDPIKLDVRGLKEVKAFLKDEPRGSIRVALQAFVEYIIGNERRGLKKEPKRVQHGPGNPYQWQSEKQRKAYFASDGFGAGIPYARTHKLSTGWTSTPKQDGYKQIIENKNAPYADFVPGVIQQRGHWADGWRKVRDVIADNFRGAVAEANRAVSKWLKERQKK